MALQVTCPQGHCFEPVSGSPAVCPQCGRLVDVTDSFDEFGETFKPMDDLPPLPTPSPDAVKNRIAFQVTGYEILEELGRGGMGVVYKARQLSLDRLVALKMILGNPAAEELARFKTEADACAQLHHPNIVQIYEIGERDGQPYLALEFIEGGSLAGYLSGAPVTPRACAQLVETLARAMHFAHVRHIIHRDLKPANILLAGAASVNSLIEKDSWPLTIQPKIADFGLAKRLDRDAGQTRAGSILGTPSYMAPEQAAGDGADAIGPATDVYALGAILYEMLTGRPPFRGVTPLDTVRQVLHEEPVPPRRLQPGTPHDLETICLKCLAKEPNGRYASAQDLADDLARFLAGQPILARPTGWHERTLKWVKRRPALAGAIAASGVAMMLLVGLGVGLYYNAWLQESLNETEKERARADRLFRLTQRYHYLGEMREGQRFWRERQTPRLLSLLKTYQIVEPGRRDLRSFEWHYLWGLCHAELLTFAEHEHPVTCIAVSPTENLVATGSGRSTLTGAGVEGYGEVRLWAADSGKLRHLLKGHTREVISVAFSADGQWLASASNDKTVRLWKVATGESAFVLKGHDVTCVAFHPNEDVVAAGCRDGTIILWNVQTGQVAGTLKKHRDPVLCIAFSPDGKRLVSGGGDPQNPKLGEIWAWDMTSSKAIASYHGHDGAISAVAFHPDGQSFAAAGVDRVIRLWNVETEKEIRQWKAHSDRVTCLAFDKAGSRLASGSADLTVMLWDPTIGKELSSRKGHLDAIRGVAFSVDGTRLLSAANDRAVKIWNAAADQEFAKFSGHAEPVTEVAFSPDGHLLASASLDHTVRIWDADLRNERQVFTGHTDKVHCVAFPFSVKNDGKTWHVVTGSDDGTIRFWDVAARKEAYCLNTPREQVRALAVSRDGTRLAYAGVKGGDDSKPAVITLFDTVAKKAVGTFNGHSSRVSSLAFSPDGGRLVSASAGDPGGVKIWDVADRTEIASFELDHATEPRAIFSPDGKQLAIANGDLDQGRIRIVDSASGKVELVLTGHAGMANALAFTPDGERLVTTDGKLGMASKIKLWDVLTGQEVLTLRGPTGLVRSLAFSADGRRLAAGGGPLAGQGGEIVIWSAATNARRAVE